MSPLIHYFMLALRSIADTFSDPDLAMLKNISRPEPLMGRVSPRFMTSVTPVAKSVRTSTESTRLIDQIESNKPLDLAFIMDTTGSMVPYIENVKRYISDLVDELANESQSDLRLALVKYRDHAPEDNTFVTQKHDFTRSVETMGSWLNETNAAGGGDTPEAVADALYEAMRLSWRKEAAKLSILISDAPPHGLVSSSDMFADGCPLEHDPIKIAHKLSMQEVTLYSVGCEPSIYQYREFFMALAYITGGQYIPLSQSDRLIDAVIGGAQEELSLMQFSTYVEQEIERVQDAGEPVDGDSIAYAVYQKLKTEGATSMQLLRNNKTLQDVTDNSKILAECSSMAEVREAFVVDREASTPHGSIERHDRMPSGYKDSFYDGYYEYESMKPIALEGLEYGEEYDMEHGAGYAMEHGADYGMDIPTSARTPASESGESYTAVKAGISLEQISRLVKKKKAKLLRS